MQLLLKNSEFDAATVQLELKNSEFYEATAQLESIKRRLRLFQHEVSLMREQAHNNGLQFREEKAARISTKATRPAAESSVQSLIVLILASRGEVSQLLGV